MAAKMPAIALSAIVCLAFVAVGCSSSNQTSEAAYYASAPGMQGVLVAPNPAVYSNPIVMTRLNLYQVGSYSLAESQAMSGASAPPISRDELVFFDLNKATLTPRARQIADRVADASRNDPALQIDLVGKADRSGSDRYNMALSQRRAEAVRSYLVAKGAAANQINTRWVGEREPPVLTADGVREARNRVVDMRLTTMSGASAPAASMQPVIAGPPPVLFTNVENNLPGSNGQVPPGFVATGSALGQFAP